LACSEARAPGFDQLFNLVAHRIDDRLGEVVHSALPALNVTDGEVGADVGSRRAPHVVDELEHEAPARSPVDYNHEVHGGIWELRAMKAEVPKPPPVIVLDAVDRVAVDVADGPEIRADGVYMLDSVLALFVPFEGLERLPGACCGASGANKGAPPHVPPIRGGVDHYEVAGVAKRAVRRHDVRRCAYRVVGRRPHGPAQRVEVGGEVAVRLSLVSVSSAFVGVGPEPSARRRFSDGFPGLSVALLVELHVGRKPSGKVGRRSAAGSSEEAVSSLHKGRSA
jgi:hypothetical protein